MRRLALLLVVLGVAGLLAACGPPSRCPRQQSFGWQGDFVQTSVTFPAPGLGTLKGTVFAPGPTGPGGRRPGVVLVHGNGGTECGQWWAARALAGEGYVAMAITVVDGDARDSADGLLAGVDFLGSSANPYQARTDAGTVGLAGHSEGSTAVALAQGAGDPRVKAVVAFDGLKRWAGGDPAAFLNCLPPRRGELTPRVPALGQHGDQPCARNPSNTDPDIKTAGFEWWKANGQPVMTMVFAGAVHGDWGGAAVDRPAYNRQFARYAAAWFDRWLLGDGSAEGVLLGAGTRDLLAPGYRSAVSFAGHRCDRLQDCL